MSTVTDTVNSRSIIFASAHRFDADIRLGSSHLAREMAKRGWRVLFIEQPTSPFHLLNPSSARVAASKLAGALAGGIASHASGTSGVEVLNAVSLLPHVNAPLLRSAFTLERWRASTLPPLSRAIAGRGFDQVRADGRAGLRGRRRRRRQEGPGGHGLPRTGPRGGRPPGVSFAIRRASAMRVIAIWMVPCTRAEHAATYASSAAASGPDRSK